MNIIQYYRKLFGKEPSPAAGCLFTDGKHVLAGYQPYKKNPAITGIGGRCKEGEEPFDTAIREMLEELFELERITTDLIKDVKLIIPRKKLVIDNYTIFAYSFDDLYIIMHLVTNYKCKSRIYEELPSTLLELISNRKWNSRRQEITDLALLPLVSNMTIDKAFINDVNLYMRL